MNCQLCDSELLTEEIDGFILCYNHKQDYLHQKRYPGTSIYKKMFDELK